MAGLYYYIFHTLPERFGDKAHLLLEPTWMAYSCRHLYGFFDACGHTLTTLKEAILACPGTDKTFKKVVLGTYNSGTASPDEEKSSAEESSAEKKKSTRPAIYPRSKKYVIDTSSSVKKAVGMLSLGSTIITIVGAVVYILFV